MWGALAVGASTPRLEAGNLAEITQSVRAAADRVAAILEGTRHD
jgi:hypothetical protein